MLFSFTAAAEVLAESNDPFEMTVLKFLSIKDDRRSGLKRFLDLKLNCLSAPEVPLSVCRTYR